MTVLKLIATERALVIGHRGCCALAPENTLPSFALALEAGADLVELDYQESQDGVLVVIHDDTLNRTTRGADRERHGRVRVCLRTAAAIQACDAGDWFHARFAGARVPLLAEAVEFILARGGVPLIEHKAGEAQTCVRLLRERNWINRVIVISFDWAYLRTFHALAPEQVLGALGPPICLADGSRPRRVSRAFSAAWLDRLAETGARIVVWNRDVSEPAIHNAQQRGLPVWVYTVNGAALARQLVKAGVKGIITNDPGLIRRAIAVRF